MSGKPISYFEPRVVRLVEPCGRQRFSIREVYFDDSGQVLAYTEDDLSPIAASIDELKAAIVVMLSASGDTVVSGQLRYEYAREDVEQWLSAAQLPAIDIEG